MQGKVIPLLFIFLMALILHEQKLTRQTFKSRTFSNNRGIEALYEAVVTGNKSGVSREFITTMKDFGLMHILTPSGLHLSSFLVLFLFFPRLKLIVTIALLVIFHFAIGFLALKRMLFFYICNYYLKNPKLSFVATFFGSLIFENYAESPLSFCFTFIFWGSIIFNNSGKWKLAGNMFIFQAIVASLFTQKINLAAIVLNPLITILFSTFFPVVLISYPIGILHPIGVWILEVFSNLITSLEYLSLLTVPGPIAVMIILAFKSKLKVVMTAFALVLSTNLNNEKGLRRKSSTLYFPVPKQFELLYTRKRKVNFIDRKCRLSFMGDMPCKKKPSEYGGPDI